MSMYRSLSYSFNMLAILWDFIIYNVCNYSLLQQNPKATSQNIEDNFDGNLCRCTGKSLYYGSYFPRVSKVQIFNCTGYRPILDAMKSFAVEHNEGSDIDIEVRDYA